MLLVYIVGYRDVKHIYRLTHCAQDVNSSFEDPRIYGRRFEMDLQETGRQHVV